MNSNLLSDRVRTTECLYESETTHFQNWETALNLFKPRMMNINEYKTRFSPLCGLLKQKLPVWAPCTRSSNPIPLIYLLL